jgi:hypothetical protein
LKVFSSACDQYDLLMCIWPPPEMPATLPINPFLVRAQLRTMVESAPSGQAKYFCNPLE